MFFFDLLLKQPNHRYPQKSLGPACRISRILAENEIRSPGGAVGPREGRNPGSAEHGFGAYFLLTELKHNILMIWQALDFVECVSGSMNFRHRLNQLNQLKSTSPFPCAATSSAPNEKARSWTQRPENVGRLPEAQFVEHILCLRVPQTFQPRICGTHLFGACGWSQQARAQPFCEAIVVRPLNSSLFARRSPTSACPAKF